MSNTGSLKTPRYLKWAALLLIAPMAAGCADMNRAQQRMLSGGAIGAASGAALVALTGGGSVVAGALVGGAAGTAAGAIMSSKDGHRK